MAGKTSIGVRSPLQSGLPNRQAMKTPRILILLSLFFAASCAAPIVLVGVGAVVGVWTYDDFTNDRGQMIVHASANELYMVAKSTVEARPNAKDFTATPGSMRIEFFEDKSNVSVQIMLMPETPEFATLKVYAAELGLRGRADLAQLVAEDISSRFK